MIHLVPFFLVTITLAGTIVYFAVLYYRSSRTNKTLEAALVSMKSELNARIEQAGTEGRRLEAILDSMSEAVFAVDSGLNLLLVNPRARSLFAIPSGSFSLLEATHSTELEGAAKKVLIEKTSVDFEVKLHKGGRQFFFQVFAAPLGQSSDVVIVLNDITKIQKLEQVRKDFAANVSHELRTPIQIIMGFAETILERNLDKKKLVHSVEIILKNAQIMENLTNDLLALVSLEDNAAPRLEMAEVNVKDLLEKAVQSVETQREIKNIRIKESCAPELNARLHGPLIIQALINLLDNAIKYSSSSSRVWISAEKTTSPEGEGELAIMVKDKGIGIPGEYQERIFERFYRVDKARSREAGGTGLGLAIVRHIALLHGGSVEVESHAGEGSCFTLRIPLT